MFKHYYGMKLRNDFLLYLKIKKLRKMAGGDLLTIIYLKIQLLSVQNSGILLFKEVESSFEEELALMLDEDVGSVWTTLQYLHNQGMIKRMDGGEYLIPDVVENMGSESDSAAKMQKFCEKCVAVGEVPSHCDANVRWSNKNVTPDIEKETEKVKKQKTKGDTERKEEATPVIMDRWLLLSKCKQKLKKYLYSILMDGPSLYQQTDGAIFTYIRERQDKIFTAILPWPGRYWWTGGG